MGGPTPSRSDLLISFRRVLRASAPKHFVDARVKAFLWVVLGLNDAGQELQTSPKVQPPTNPPPPLCLWRPLATSLTLGAMRDGVFAAPLPCSASLGTILPFGTSEFRVSVSWLWGEGCEGVWIVSPGHPQGLKPSASKGPHGNPKSKQSKVHYRAA